MNRLTKSAGSLVAAMAVAAASAVTASAAADPDVDVEGSAEVVAFLEKYGVPQQTQDDLMAQLAAGERWDSMSSDSDPVDTSVTGNGVIETTVHRYDDGSVAVIEQTIPETREAAERRQSGGIETSAISQCIRNESQWQITYTNCWVDGNMGVSRMHFRFDYRTRSGSSAITAVRNPFVQFAVGEASGTTLRITRANSTSSLPATGRLSTWVDLPAPAGGYTAWLEARISNSGARSDAWYM